MTQKPIVDQVGNIRIEVVDPDNIDDKSMGQLLEGIELTPQEIKTNLIQSQFYKKNQKNE